ncbi:exopolyphosphatase (plasmid) [Thermus oshimai JL-2]|uniref:Exopolyphosphatase n=1 Tax=Thermus oshimai JL-2 TaxID=751945 RepID=K7QZ47_THEOS|nr:Ppx/GppA phosphatase family protein [Thermus oshimai]AFV77368.1 exopolyphosphatase [Thermus oshimai JL-2]
MERLGLVDLGSGTARLVVYAYEPGRWFRLVDEIREPVRLGEGLASGHLTPEAQARAQKALRLFADFARATGLETVEVMATSALRDAKNGPSLLQALEGIGLPIRVLSGEEEARLGALAVANSFPWEEAWVVDLGGGSVQISRLEGRRFVQGRAYPLGAVRLKERFLLGDPPRKREVVALEAHVLEVLREPLKALAQRPAPLVAMGGTVRNLAEMVQKRKGYPLNLLHGYWLAREDLEGIVEEILSLPLSARRELEGLQPDRADILPAGALVYRTLLRAAGYQGLWVSGQGLREGRFYQHFLPPPHLLEDVRRFSVENLFAQYPQEPGHTARVRNLARTLFRALGPLHGYGPEEERLLDEAALLHDIGMSLGYYDHHKHGAYLVAASPLPGMDHRTQALLALLVRYHRKGKPQPGPYRSLFLRGDAKRLERLAALLRLAEYLDRSRVGRVKGVEVRLEGGRVELWLRAPEEPWAEMVEAGKQAGLFQKAFGLELEVRWTP